MSTQFTLSKYKDYLGMPSKGIHQYRFLGMAVMDIIMTIVGAIIISSLTQFKLVYVVPSLFLLGIILHRLFSVRTTVDKLLFDD